MADNLNSRQQTGGTVPRHHNHHSDDHNNIPNDHEFNAAPDRSSPQPLLPSKGSKKSEPYTISYSIESGSLAGTLAAAGLVAVPASYATLWLTATSLKLASAATTFALATAVSPAAPYLAVGGVTTYATVKGGGAVATRTAPYVLAVARGLGRRARDVRKVVAARLKREGGPDHRDDGGGAELGDVVADSEDNTVRLLSIEDAVRMQKEQQQNGTESAFAYYGVQLYDSISEVDADDPWLIIDPAGNDHNDDGGGLGDDEWIDVG